MNNFNFRLQSVLDIRVQKEEENKLNYKKAEIEKNKVVTELSDLRDDYSKYSDISSIDDINTQLLARTYVASLTSVIDKKSDELKLKELGVSKAKKELIDSQIDRKAIEKLKDTQYDEYKKCLDRKEQNENDEYALYGFMRTLKMG